MANINDLISEMQHTTIGTKQNENNFHELTLEYPVLDLLASEEASRLALLPPDYAGFRAEPDINNFSLKTSGTDFVTRLPLSKAVKPCKPGHYLFQMLDSLETAPGRSLLQAVTFKTRAGTIIYRFQLTIKVAGSPHTAHGADLSPCDWATIVVYYENTTWCQLLRNLLSRASDRAYLHVHERLQSYRWYTKQQHEEEWSWDELHDANQLVAWNLARVRRTRSGKKTEPLPVTDIASLPDREAGFVLPCRHKQLIYVPMLKTMSANLCKTFCCDTCGESVMQEEDFWRLQRFVEREQRDAFAVKESMWKRLDSAMDLGRERPLRTHSIYLALAVKHAFESIKVPESASPTVLNFATSIEAAAILESMKQLVAKCNEEINLTPMLVFMFLINLRDKALADLANSPAGKSVTPELPVDWDRVTVLWFMRAVKLVSLDGYDGRGIEEASGSSAWKGEGAVERGEALGELTRLMGNAGGLEARV